MTRRNLIPYWSIQLSPLSPVHPEVSRSLQPKAWEFFFFSFFSLGSQRLLGLVTLIDDGRGRTRSFYKKPSACSTKASGSGDMYSVMTNGMADAPGDIETPPPPPNKIQARLLPIKVGPSFVAHCVFAARPQRKPGVFLASRDCGGTEESMRAVRVTTKSFWTRWTKH